MEGKLIFIFGLLVFGVIFTLSLLLKVPVPGSSRDNRKRLQHRLENLDSEETPILPMELLRERFRHTPSSLEYLISHIPKLKDLARSLEIPGIKISGYTYLLIGFVLVIVGSLGGWLLTESLLVSAMMGPALGSLPFLKIQYERNARFNLFEEQLVGALDIMIRAMRAGYPFAETLRQVARELEDPIATEFRVTFDEINAGIEVRTALRNLLDRVPSLSLMAMVTTVLLQRETGGNLSESLSNISGVIRGRFKFQRHIKTLTAESRISAWVLGLMPFLLFLILYFLSPEMISNFVKDPDGQDMILYALIWMGLGILWMRKLMNLEV